MKRADAATIGISRNDAALPGGQGVSAGAEILSNFGTLEPIWFDTPGLLSDRQVTELRDW